MTAGAARAAGSGSDGHPAPEDRRVRQALAAAPFLLLALSLGFTVATEGRPVPGERMFWIVAVTLAALALRLWWQLASGSPRQRVVGFVVNLALTLVLITLSPLFGVYAFAGYLDAVAVFSGPGQVYALIAVGSLNALAQSGGPSGAVVQPVVFGFLLVANCGLAVAMVHIDKHRQRTVGRLQRTLAELAQANRANAALQEQVVDQARAAGILEERQRLSREIHDTVAQGLIALLRQIEAASESTTIEVARARLARADATARDSLAEARRAVQALASPRLDGADLPHALQVLVSGWSEASGRAATFGCAGTPVATPHDADLLRICQEALANVTKHAGDARVTVTLGYGDDQVTLDVQDDGAGFDPVLPGAGHGLPGMRERAREAGGALTLTTAEGDGCAIRAAIPL
ncbi:sensor histidine kinase [Naumannella sp. ID2617S]|nr:sensor histidine kinase [Naumannella sp. ID2617S]